MPKLSIEGNIVNIYGVTRGRVEIGDDGIIAAVGKDTGNADFVLKDELIFPGFIDLHVHARECVDHSWDYKEDFATAGAAAINGGVVAFADMPNNPVPPLDDASYKAKAELIKKSAVGILLYAGITPNTSPLSQIVPYKVYMTKSTGDLFFQSREQLEPVIKKYQGQNISFHCEDPKILDENKNQPTHSLQRPPEAEVSAIDIALGLIEKYNIKAKICHCSTVAGVEKIKAAKKRGLSVTVEITPHHLYFDESSLSTEKQKQLQINPPVRNNKHDRLKLIEYLKNGDIDYLATDHSPHTAEDKQKGATGMPHLDTYGPFVSWLMAEHGFTPADVMRVCSLNPGKFLNDFLPFRFGKIEPGFIGSLTVLDMAKPITINKSMLKTKCGWLPFEGITFPGSVTMTVVKGKSFSPLTPHLTLYSP